MSGGHSKERTAKRVGWLSMDNRGNRKADGVAMLNYEFDT